MLREVADWFAALFLASAIAVTLLGVHEWCRARAREALPATADAYTVAVDPGHGGFDGGATGVVSGTPEAGLNLNVALQVAETLERYGVTVVMTREDGAALGADKRSDLARRKELITGERIDLVVSVHMNKFTDPSVSGMMAYYQNGSHEGQKLAQTVADAVCDAIGRNRRLANPGDYFILRECACPAVLVECGFLSNAEEEQKLLDEAYQTLLGEAIARGVLNYLGIQ